MFYVQITISIRNNSEKKILKTLEQTEQNNSFCQKSYFTKILDKIKQCRKTWQILQSVLPTNTNKLSAITIDEQKDPKTVVNSSYTFFCNIGKSKLIKSLIKKTTHF